MNAGRPSRRLVLAALGGATVFPFAAIAQQMPVVGFLHSTSSGDRAANRSAFRDGLSEAGFTEGRNVTIADRWGEYHPERLPSLAADLVQRKVDVLFASGGDNSVAAALAATKTIPIVFVTANDPVRAGYVESLARPGGNATGVAFVASALEAKRLEVLHELVPRAHSTAAFFGPSNRRAERERREMEGAARTLGFNVRFLQVKSDAELEASLAAIVGERPDALHFVTDAFFYARAARLGAFVAEIGIPASFNSRHFVELGGLLSYGASTEEAYRAGGRYVAKILKGAKPADLPVEQADKIALVINLKAAQALGIDVPPTLLSRADEVIE